MVLARVQGSVVVGALAVLISCGGGSDGQGGQASGVQVVLQTGAAFARAPDFDARLTNTLEVALQYWGGTWGDVEGRTITLVDDPSVPCNGVESLGCFDGNIRLSTRDPGLGTFPCVEATVLVHEVGHAVLGDPDHTDPRWMEMDSVATELAGRPGYGDGGEEPCVTYPSVWRHPLGTP